MVINFFKAVFSPTQYIYRKDGGQIFTKEPIRLAPNSSLFDLSQKQLKDFLNMLPKSKNKLDQKETIFFQSLNQYAADKPIQTTVPSFVAEHAFTNRATAPQPMPQPSQAPRPSNTASDVAATQALQQTAALLEKQLKEAKTREAEQAKVDPKAYLEAHQKVLEMQNSLSSMSLEKQQLESKLIDLQKKLTDQGKPVFSPSMATPVAPSETKFVRSVPQTMQKSVGLPITPEFPNVITGIVKDPRGNPLPNILVEVKDDQGNATRAFKTNALGQFASATPLSNGSFTIEFEDPREQNKFDKIAFKADGNIILPIEIISVDIREELRRSLFN
jgi:HPt (histidine-containing phosphotransfer) domain-containing protein